MAVTTDRHRPGYYAEREQKDKELRKAAKRVSLQDAKHQRKEREKWREDLRGFLVEVSPETFYMGFSKDHEDCIAKMQHMIINGGTQAIAMPRGSGKSSLARWASLWAVLYGWRKYGAVLASDQRAAEGLLESMKTDIWLSAGIGKYWPRLQEFIARGDGQAQKYRHMLNSDGSPPLIKWGKDMIRLPITPEEDGDVWSGAVLQARGLTGGVRGMQTKGAGGETMRPDFCLIDDPQTKDVASSPTQIQSREEIIQGDVMGLAGPGKEISAFMLMTVIEPNDLAERFLDKKQHPEWYGIRVPMIKKFPDEVDKLWEEYRIKYLDALQEGVSAYDATSFYSQNREQMDKGGEVYWEDRKTESDVSALQHAMNLRIRLGTAFLSEYQNEPVQHTGGKPYEIDTISVMKRTNGRKSLDVPPDAMLIASHTDINYRGLNTVVTASTNDAVRYIVDYGIYPGNGAPLYSVERGKKIGESDKMAISRGLDSHMATVCSARYLRDGKYVRPDVVLIDAGFHLDLVFRWCEANRHRYPMVYPSQGRSDSKYRPTQLVGKPGDNLHVGEYPKRGRVLIHNSDHWRMVAQKSFLLPVGVPGSTTIFGKKGHLHKGFADEVCSEQLVEYIEMSEAGRSYFDWRLKPGCPNDKLDAYVGSLAALSYLGASENGLGVNPSIKVKKRRRTSNPRIMI